MKLNYKTPNQPLDLFSPVHSRFSPPVVPSRIRLSKFHFNLQVEEKKTPKRQYQGYIIKYIEVAFQERVSRLLRDTNADVALVIPTVGIFLIRSLVNEKYEKILAGASIMLTEFAIEAGLPNGVLNIVHGTNDIVNAICDDEDIKTISFVGSNTAVMHIYIFKSISKREMCSVKYGSQKSWNCDA
ncbi:hypothetical protein L2E82_30616 [Cichorium intybus]|uniref:Uncharacterized protein n=1 Tax=Cichorium intybus TaxID=13427 RepID=A0ACB9D1C7_CICIN|nr:hypothetical protein L2E82_30616 [Cichorium intybus]